MADCDEIESLIVSSSLKANLLLQKLPSRMRICLIGATHTCHNPRLLREADSFAHAGHDVRVIAPCYMEELAQKDERQIARRGWRYQRVDFRPSGLRGRQRYGFIRGRRRLAQELFRGVKSARVAEYSYTAALPELTALAAREGADWFIAHTQASLPVAAAAAARWRARLGFDCEDLLAESGSDPTNVVRLIEGKYLPLCTYVSTPSRCIADYLVQCYGLSTPLVLYNVFPLSLADGLVPPAQRPASQTLRLHWFSQTIGHGRGLEDAFAAVALLETNVELHLRGLEDTAYVNSLTSRYNLQDKVFIHAPTDHDDLIRAMEGFDVGLALELSSDGNYSRTVTNKIGSYLLAGLAIAASDTPGQRELMRQVSDTGFLYPSGEPQALAQGLSRWLKDQAALRAAQQAAWDVARREFCWDVEQEKLLPLFRQQPTKGAQHLA
jgi:glycosyltransferase involved in cell wall biosynthesis